MFIGTLRKGTSHILKAAVGHRSLGNHVSNDAEYSKPRGIKSFHSEEAQISILNQERNFIFLKTAIVALFPVVICSL